MRSDLRARLGVFVDSGGAAAPLTSRIGRHSTYPCATVRPSLPANLLLKPISAGNSPAVPQLSLAALIPLDADSQVGIAGSPEICPAGSPIDRCKQLPSIAASSEEFRSLKLHRSGAAETWKWGETGTTMEERARIVGGRFSIDSHMGAGTRVEVVVPAKEASKWELLSETR